ncbi:Phosphatidyl serine synthase [Phytophthora cactorum]|nr:Phosphatidyl serine synthase [Phytophthora cactorum]
MQDEVAQRTVLRSRRNSDLDDDPEVYGNEPGSNYENRKWSMEETVEVDDDNESQWISSPHTLTAGFLLMLWIVYAAFHEPVTPLENPDEQFAADVKRGVKYACVFFLTYCSLQLPDGHFMLLILLLFLKTNDARQFMKLLDPSLGVELPETSYAADCRATFFDRFVIMHFFGWIVGSIMVRSKMISWILSVMFELYEITFSHWLANFNECWWDHLFFDIFTCNAAGIYLGMKICRYFEMRRFNWVGIRKIPNLTGKAKRALAQFTPAYWMAYDWKIFRSAERFWRVMSMVTILSIMMLNSFFLKTQQHQHLSPWVWYSAGSYAVAEYYIFCSFTMNYEGKKMPVQKLGPRAWLAIFAVLVFGSTIYFKCINKPLDEDKKTQ